MAKIFITGSTDGLGFLSAKSLLENGHQVILHARNEERASQIKNRLPNAFNVVIGDLSIIEETISVANQVNKIGTMDSIIHNAGIGYREPTRLITKDLLPHVFAVNSLAPYILTCLLHKPQRLIYTSSGLHWYGNPTLTDILWENREWNGMNAYCDTKLHNILLSMAVSRIWESVFSNALEPGWVATKMGGKEATDSLEDGYKTQVWLASSQNENALVSGCYFYHKMQKEYLTSVLDIVIQEKFLNACQRFSGIAFPK